MTNAKPSLFLSETRLALQGERVILWHRRADGNVRRSCVLTLVQVRDLTQPPEMHLINREDKSRRPDWVLTERHYASMQPAPAGNKQQAQWQLTLAW